MGLAKSRTKYTRLDVRYTIREFCDVCGDGEETDVSAIRALCYGPVDWMRTHSWLFRFPLFLASNERDAVMVRFSVLP